LALLLCVLCVLARNIARKGAKCAKEDAKEACARSDLPTWKPNHPSVTIYVIHRAPHPVFFGVPINDTKDAHHVAQ
jgi:hypothetical protein